jgi:hypothetical protein
LTGGLDVSAKMRRPVTGNLPKKNKMDSPLASRLQKARNKSLDPAMFVDYAHALSWLADEVCIATPRIRRLEEMNFEMINRIADIRNGTSDFETMRADIKRLYLEAVKLHREIDTLCK